jgi:transcriptional regulator with XRE-family HTH domain
MIFTVGIISTILCVLMGMTTTTPTQTPKRGDLIVGKRIASRRKELGMDRSALARAAGVSYVYVAQLETGYRMASYRKQIALAEALGVGLDDLFGSGTAITTPLVLPSSAPTRDEAVAIAVDALAHLPRSVRLDALNTVQRAVLDSLGSA